MTRGALAGKELRPFRTLLVRRAVLSPELERFLSRRHVDLAVTDQLEALQVRVRAGIDLFHRRVHCALKRTRTRLMILAAALALSVLLGAAASAAAWATPHAYKGWIASVIGFTCAAGCGIALVRLGLDRAQLRRLNNRYAGIIEKARNAGELLAFAEKVLDEARTLGAVPRMEENA